MQEKFELPVAGDTVVLVVSDIHLRLPVTRELGIIQRSLVDRIAQLGKNKNAILVLNGDIFELWEQTKQTVADIITGFDELSVAIQKFAKGRGHRVIYVVGNHDDLLAESATDRAVVEGRWKADFTMEFQFEANNKRFLVQHGHQYDPYNMPSDTGDSHGKKLVRKTLPFLQEHLPSLFENIGDVNDRSLLGEYVIGNFTYKLFVPVISPLVLMLGLISAIYYKNWMILIWSSLALIMVTALLILVSYFSRFISNLVLGGGESFLKKVDRARTKNKTKVIVLGHTHQGGIFKRGNYTYANSGCNDIVATKRVGWLGVLKFDHSLQLSSITIDLSKKQPLEYYQQNLPLVE